MPAQLKDFHPATPIGPASVLQSCRLQSLDVLWVYLEPVAVALEHRSTIVEFGDHGVRVNVHIMRPEAHRGAHRLHGALLRQQVNHGILRLRIELRAVRALEAEHMAGEFDRRELEPEAHPLERDLLLPRVLDRFDLSLNPAIAEPSGDQDPIDALE